jgi:AcrR family transcriptional regulator
MASWANVDVQASADRRVRRRARRVNAVLEMTALVVGEHGYHNASIEEIAERLDVAKPTVYHYFESKEKLVYETLRVCADYVHSALAEVAKVEGSPTERLRNLIRRHIELISIEYPEMSRLFNQHVDWPEPIAQAVRGWQHEHDALFRTVIVEGLSAGEFDVSSPALARSCLYGAISVVPNWIDRHGTADHIDEATDLVMRLVLPTSRQ